MHDTAHYVEWLSRASLSEVAERPELAPQLAAVEAERVRELEDVKKLAVWHDDVVVFDRFDDVGARSPGFLGYLLFGRDIEDGAVQLSGIIGSVLGAVILLLIWRAFSDRGHRGTRLSH